MFFVDSKLETFDFFLVWIYILLRLLLNIFFFFLTIKEMKFTKSAKRILIKSYISEDVPTVDFGLFVLVFFFN